MWGTYQQSVRVSNDHHVSAFPHQQSSTHKFTRIT